MTELAASLWEALTYIGAFALVIIPLVLVHEFGHYWVAIKCGVKVETFSIGFGKALFSFTDKRGTRWKFAPWLLGGYVQMFGDSDPTSAKTDERFKDLPPEQLKAAFFSKNLWQRTAIVAAGPGINFLFAFILFYGLFITIGQSYTPAKISEVVADSPAMRAGILVGDRITQLDDTPVDSISEIRRYLMLNLEREVTLRVDRNGQEVVIVIKPEMFEEKPLGESGPTSRTPRLGVVAEGIEIREHTIVSAAGAAVAEMYNVGKSNLVALWQIITGQRDHRELGSVITIAKVSKTAAESWTSIISFIAFFSVVLGVINLIPIPGLDGGHLLFYAIEAVRRKPLSAMAQEYCLRFGLAMIITLMVFAFWTDLVNNGVIAYLHRLFF